jgi:arginase family enzyme
VLGGGLPLNCAPARDWGPRTCTVFHHAAQEGLIVPKWSVQVGIRSVNRRDDIVCNRALGFRLIDAESVNMRGVPWVVQCIPEVGGLFSWQARTERRS